MKAKAGVIKTCPQCGVEFRRPPWQAGSKFCGMACRRAHYAAREKVCEECGKAYAGSALSGWPERTAGKRFCSKGCMGLAQRRRIVWQCRDCGREEMRTPGAARRYQRCGPCGAAYRGELSRGRPLAHVVDPVVRERWLRSQRSPERRERVSRMLTGRARVTELTRRDSPRHAMALHIAVKSPAGVTYLVDNVAAFVRSHPELFDREDVVDRSPRAGSYRSRAAAGLRTLQSVAATRLSWKGWTLAFGCRDELGRRPLAAGDAVAETINQGSTDEDTK